MNSIWLFLSIGCFIILIIINIIKKRLTKNSHYLLEKDIKKHPQISILIPARNESLVIEDLLKSIVNQTYKINPLNVYIIVEDKDDPTIKIAKKYNMNIFIRKDFKVKTKGYALDELLKYLSKKNQYYDLYFIFDADNILDKNFIKQMVYKYREGYSIATGYRALKNQDNAISISSWLTFLLVNDYRNKTNLNNILLSGTGYYIHGRIIKNNQGFPFYSLTEDYELSIYACLNKLSTTYNKKAIFYDTQPTKYLLSIKQRSRWIKGYILNWFKNYSKLFKNIFFNDVNACSNFEFWLGIIPGIIKVIFLFSILMYFFKSIILVLIILYFLSVFLTIYLINNSYLKLNFSLKFKTILYHPLFLLSYLHAFFIFIFKKNLGWDIISHK